MHEPIQIRGQCELADYVDSQATAAFKRRMVLKIIICVVGLLMMMQESWWERGLGLAAVAYAAFLSDMIFRRLAGLQWEAGTTAQPREVDFRMDATGIENTDSEGNTSQVAWDQFTRWTEGTRVILLFLPANRWLMIPKRFLTGEQLAALRTVLSTNIGPR